MPKNDVVTATRYVYVHEIATLDNVYTDDQQQAMIQMNLGRACVYIPLKQLAEVLFPEVES